MLGKNKVKVLAVFGADNFNTNIIGQSHSGRSKRLSSIVSIFKEINPQKVLYIPTKGINAVLGGILNELKIKRTMIVPFPGYADTLPRIQRLLVKEAWDDKYASAFFLEDKEIEADFVTRSRLLKQATWHLISQSDAALVLHGKSHSTHLDEMFSLLEKNQTPTYVFNYDDIN